MREVILSACSAVILAAAPPALAAPMGDGDTRVRTRSAQPYAADAYTQVSLWGTNRHGDYVEIGRHWQPAGGYFDHNYRRARRLSHVRTYDGSLNHLRYRSLGAADTRYKRTAGRAQYGDGIGEMLGGTNTRVISNTLSLQSAPLGNSRDLSSMFWQWGQFIDHDINLTEGGDEFTPIVITAPDPVFEIGAVIPFTRSAYVRGTSETGPRQYTNGITHWMDASMVYGSDRERAHALRAFEGGRLLTGDDGFMPRNTAGLHNDDGGGVLDEATQFLAGDIRVNEQAGLTAMHEVFVRYHNDWADRLSEQHTRWSDERVYQTARKIVGAQVQSITYNDWLTALVGEDALRDYRGYRRRVDARQSLVFSTAAFRLGHTMLTDELERYNADGSLYADGHLGLTQAFFNPNSIASEDAIAAVLRGLARQEANEIDTQAVESVRSFLFGDPAVGGLDLIAMNLQRGRDHGLGDYNTIRKHYGLDRVDSFDDITSDEDLADALAEVYDSVDDIDAWIGLMAEDHLDDASVGQTLSVILIDQFTRMRDGDRFWYENDRALRPYIDEIEATSLADVIARVTDAELSGDVFFVNEPPTATFVAVPEPATMTLLAAGVLLIARRRRADA